MKSTRPAELAESAFTLFSQRGIDRVTMDDIAADANVTKGSLYWHYASKNEIVEAAARHYYREWHRDAQRQIARETNLINRIRILVRSSVKSCLIDEKNRIFTMEILQRSAHDPILREGWRQFFDGVKVFYQTLVDTAAESGLLDLENSEAKVDTMLAAMEGYKMRAVFEPDLLSRAHEKEITRELLALLHIEP